MFQFVFCTGWGHAFEFSLFLSFSVSLSLSLCLSSPSLQQRVLGVHVLGPSAGEIIHGFATALRCALTKDQLDATVGLHPMCAEVLCTVTLKCKVPFSFLVLSSVVKNSRSFKCNSLFELSWCIILPGITLPLHSTEIHLKWENKLYK